jgi:hypothetical protein
MPYYTRQGKELVPYKEDVPEEAILAIERADEQSIVESLTAPEKQKYFAYSYEIMTKEGPRQIIGISVDGAAEIALELGNIEVLPDLKVEDRDDYFYAMLRARDLTRNTTLMGVGRQCKYQVGKGYQPDRERPNEWAFVQAVSKGQRNSILAIAPQEAIIKIVEKLKPEFIKKLPPPGTLGKGEPGKQEEKKDEVKEEKASEAERKEVINSYIEMKSWKHPLTQDQKGEITKFFADTTGKIAGWTKSDIEKLKAEIAKAKLTTKGDVGQLVDEL